MNRLRFADTDLAKYMPGFESDLERFWVAHRLPGQRGRLQEDLGDGSLGTQVPLQFVGPNAEAEYQQVLQALAKSPKGPMLHPTRGQRYSVIKRWRERMMYTTQGTKAILVDLTFEDAAVSEPDQFKGQPATAAQEVNAQVARAISLAVALKSKVFTRPDLIARRLALKAVDLVNQFADHALTYAQQAMATYTAVSAPDPGLQQQLQALPERLAVATTAMRKAAGGSVADSQPAVTSMEMALAAASRLDALIRAAQPVPIETEITRSPGQSIYAFVQQWYGRSGKTPAEMRELVQTILQQNQIRNPALIPFGTIVVRPSA